jgi:hypothetical protein
LAPEGTEIAAVASVRSSPIAFEAIREAERY